MARGNERLAQWPPPFVTKCPQLALGELHSDILVKAIDNQVFLCTRILKRL